MRANIVMSALVVVGGIALAVPGFAQQDRNYPNGARPGSYGMDVAPGGGAYTRADVAAEPGDRMSHPMVGERRAPSTVSQGSLAQVDAAENAETARLNEQQLNGQTAQLPNQ